MKIVFYLFLLISFFSNYSVGNEALFLDRKLYAVADSQKMIWIDKLFYWLELIEFINFPNSSYKGQAVL